MTVRISLCYHKCEPNAKAFQPFETQRQTACVMPLRGTARENQLAKRKMAIVQNQPKKRAESQVSDVSLKKKNGRYIGLDVRKHYLMFSELLITCVYFLSS